MSRSCVVCGKPIEGRSHKILCSNACTIRLHRARKRTLIEMKALLLSITDTNAINALENLTIDLLTALQPRNDEASVSN